MQIVKIKISDFFKNSLRLILFLPFQVLFGFVEADGAQESASNVLYIDRMDNPLLNELKGMNNSYRKRPSSLKRLGKSTHPNLRSVRTWPT